MKHLLIFAAITSFVIGIAFAEPDPADKKEDACSDQIVRTQDVPYTEPEFDATAKQIGDTVIFPIWAYISGNDTLALFKTLHVAKYKGLKKIHIYLNSGGGSAFDGLGLADVILGARKDGFEVTAEANGLVASAAVPIFAVCDYRIATAGTIFMVHEASLFKFISDEKKGDLIAQTKMIELLEGRYNELIAKRSKLSVEELQLKCAQTTWFTAQQAMEWGLVDEIK